MADAAPNGLFWKLKISTRMCAEVEAWLHSNGVHIASRENIPFLVIPY